MNYRLILFIILSNFSSAGCSLRAEQVGSSESLPGWSPAYLDIHHINTGRGDTAFFIFPDGTTMLFDCGDLNTRHLKNWQPLKIAKARPNNSETPGRWIVQYINQVRPGEKQARLNYAVISHFHSDHYGVVTESSRKSIKGDYFLTGITEVGDSVPIETLIDRHDPGYTGPVEIQNGYRGKETYHNYLRFIDYHRTHSSLKHEPLKPGSNQQIILKYHRSAYPGFSVRNVKSNSIIWTGEGGDTFEYFNAAEILKDKSAINENPLSLALKINYGDFDYFTGGDMTGSQELGEPYWFDVETPVGKAVKEVDVLALNHHGNRDATNANFLKSLKPRVIIQQSWISDHPGGEVLHRMISKHLYPGARDLFATNMLEETKVAIGPWLTKGYKSMQGHVVIRVLPGGSEYFVYVLDDSSETLPIKAKYGPYQSR